MAALFAAGAPFVPGVDLVLFFGAGLAYSMFLALFGVGLGLAYPSPAVWWWILSGAVPVVGMAGLLLLSRSDPDIFFRILPGAARGLLAVLSVWLLVGLVVASSGWVRYARWYRSASGGQPGVAPDPRRHQG
jgi:hypothetical protein